MFHSVDKAGHDDNSHEGYDTLGKTGWNPTVTKALGANARISYHDIRFRGPLKDRRAPYRHGSI